MNVGMNYNSIDDVDFMVYVGHGLKKGTKYSPGDGSSYIRNTNALHFYTNNGNKPHLATLGGESQGNCNLTTIEASEWGGSGTKTKWVAIFSCNFLNTYDQYAKKENIMNGLHILMGFSTKMYVDSRQAVAFSQAMRDGQKIIESFFSSCSYQTNRIKGGTTAVVYYAKKSRNDTIYSFSSKPSLSDNTQYVQLTRKYE